MKILIVDDHQLVCDGYVALLSEQAGWTVVASASSGTQALEAYRAHRPDVVLMDIGLPGINGIEATRLILEEGAKGKQPGRIVIVSMHTDHQLVAEAFRAGASGYVVKGASTQELIQAIQAVRDGRTYLSPEVAGTVVDRFVNQTAEQASSPLYALLTPRERQTMQLLVDGKSVKEAAVDLGLSDKTVHAFRASLMDKLGLQSTADLVKYAIRHGMASLD